MSLDIIFRQKKGAAIASAAFKISFPKKVTLGLQILMKILIKQVPLYLGLGDTGNLVFESRL